MLLSSSHRPTALWDNFLEICNIPHPSKHEAALIAFLAKRAKAEDLESVIDAAGNLIVRKPAHPDLANRPGVILQAHVDMVPQANSSVDFDFTKDRIRPRTDGDWVKATDTTLGADNGIAVAAMLAIMEDRSLRHGPLEFLFTIEEEIGLHGALALQSDLLKGQKLINLDNEDIGDIAIGCAGGRDVILKTPTQRTAPSTTAQAICVQASGLKGGHSGCDIHLGRGNANIILAQALKAASTACPSVQLATMNGGSASNAIPREAEAVITITVNERTDANSAIDKAITSLKAEYVATDPEFSITITDVALPETVITTESTQELLKVISSAHNGVARMSDTVEGVPETSANLGIITTANDHILAVHKVRSSINSARDELCQEIAKHYASITDNFELGAAYPGWAPKPDTDLIQTLKTIYQNQNGKAAHTTVMHAGLECGVLGAIYPNWDMAAIGPTIRNPHSPDECVHIKSVEMFWKWLVAALEEL